MAHCLRALSLAIIALLSGCSFDTVKRTIYETFQNIRQERCMRNLSSDCEKRESYEDYERKRKELEASK